MVKMTYNPFSVVREFEEMIAEYAGSKYAVAVESCSAALFLSCLCLGVCTVTIPCFTYPSVPCAIINAGGAVRFRRYRWKGIYELEPCTIYDSALRFKKRMYEGGLHCLSFHIKKQLPIGRGGMILTNDKLYYDWLKRKRFDGRRELPLEEDDYDMIGWNFYMEPAQAARGIQLFNVIKDKNLPDLDSTKQGYPDLSKYPVYQRKK